MENFIVDSMCSLWVIRNFVPSNAFCNWYLLNIDRTNEDIYIITEFMDR